MGTDAKNPLTIVEVRYLRGLTIRAAWFWIGWAVAIFMMALFLQMYADMKSEIRHLQYIQMKQSQLDKKQEETANFVQKSTESLAKAWEQQNEAIKTMSMINDAIGIVASSQQPTGTYSKR